MERNQLQFSKAQWKGKQSSRRCAECVKGGAPSENSGGKTPIQEAARNDALEKTRAQLQKSVTSWIQRSETVLEWNPAVPQGAAKREINNLKHLQRQLRRGPPADWNEASCGVWCPRCELHEARFRS